MQQIKASYYGLMSEVDDCLGRLFEALKQMGAWDDTLVIFSSDHGEQMGDQWLIGKCGYFDPSYHIPLIIRDPRPAADSTRGSQLACFTENVDIMPTMLDYLDLPVPGQCQGYSLKSIVETGNAPAGWRTEAHWEFDFRNILDSTLESELGITQEQCALAVIRDERYKYVHFTALPPLFFDLQQDPHELHNLADDPAYTHKMLEYVQKLVSWRMNNEDHGYSQTYLCEPSPVTRLSPRTQLEATN
jgi:arylsulfatase A-like enzyme